MDINSLAHTKWNCKYHIVFAPKYRRKVVYGKMKQDITGGSDSQGLGGVVTQYIIHYRFQQVCYWCQSKTFQIL